MTSTTASTPVELDQIHGSWGLDPIHSALGFQVAHMVVTRFRGSFTAFDAHLESDGSVLSLRGTAQVASVTTAEQKLYGHLQAPDFFDAAQHPELRFESDRIDVEADGRVTVQGQITMRGVTGPLELVGTLTGPVDDAYGMRRLGLDLEGVVDRTAFGISWNAPLPGGGMAVSNQVRLAANLAFVQQG